MTSNQNDHAVHAEHLTKVYKDFWGRDKVRALVLKYPGRILYGVDASWKPYLRNPPPTDAQRKGHMNRLELQYKADFDYYAGKGEITYNGRKVEALNLPRSVLEKFYHENAERLFKLDAAWKGKK